MDTIVSTEDQALIDALCERFNFKMSVNQKLSWWDTYDNGLVVVDYMDTSRGIDSPKCFDSEYGLHSAIIGAFNDIMYERFQAVAKEILGYEVW